MQAPGPQRTIAPGAQLGNQKPLRRVFREAIRAGPRSQQNQVGTRASGTDAPTVRTGIRFGYGRDDFGVRFGSPSPLLFPSYSKLVQKGPIEALGRYRARGI